MGHLTYNRNLCPFCLTPDLPYAFPLSLTVSLFLCFCLLLVVIVSPPVKVA